MEETLDVLQMGLNLWMNLEAFILMFYVSCWCFLSDKNQKRNVNKPSNVWLIAIEIFFDTFFENLTKYVHVIKNNYRNSIILSTLSIKIFSDILFYLVLFKKNYI